MIDKVIILDIDGVLCIDDSNRFAKYTIDNLIEIINIVGCKIVLSSTWRVSDWRYNLKMACHQVDDSWIDLIIDITPDFANLDDSVRTKEISAWLDDNKPNQYVIIDDIDVDLPNVVRTKFRTGLDSKAKNAAIRLFGNQSG